MCRVLYALLVLLLPAVASAQLGPNNQLNPSPPGLAAWSSDSPAPSCGSGTLTTATVARRYNQMGKTVFLSMKITLTIVNTCGASLIVGIPFTAQAEAAIACRDNAVNSVAFIGAIGAGGATVGFVPASGTFAVTNGQVLDCSGVYESQ